MAPKKLHRYTSFSSLAHMLLNKKLTLLDPQGWDDRNDAYFIEAYREHIDAKKIYGLCFTESRQKYHHWSVFASGSDGVCISFHGQALIDSISNAGDFEFEKVRYTGTKKEMENVPLSDHQLKFTKHHRYSDEQEWRLIYTDNDGLNENPTVPFCIRDIYRITISPWLAKPLVTSLRTLIKEMPDCSKVQVRRSTLVNYQDWRSMADRSIGRVKK